MNIHKNARTTVHGRAEIVRRVLHQGQPVRGVATAFGISERTVRKWVARRDAVADRSSRPHASPDQTPGELQELIERLRRQRWTGAEIARALALSPATVARYLRRRGLARLRALEPPPPVIRYAYRHPGALLHVDIKKLGRISVRGAGHRVLGHRASQYSRRVDGRMIKLTGFEYLHVMIDDHSRLAYAEVLDDLTSACAVAFLSRASDWFADRGVRIQAVMSDNGSCYLANAYRDALDRLELKHLRIRPGRPRTNGKAERLIQTLLNEWAYARIYGSSQERTAALTLYLQRYNYQRPHGSLSHQPPASRLNNLVRNYT